MLNKPNQLDASLLRLQPTIQNSSQKQSHFGCFQRGDPHIFSHTKAKTDEDWMHFALLLATQAHGQTGSNPAVGAVIVKDGKMVGMGAHLKQGTEHAEIHALNMARNNAKGATLYVTLEPCCHTGLTGPCTAAVIQSGIERVVIAISDSNPQVGGKGIDILISAGLSVKVGILEDEALALYHTFFYTQATKRSYVIVKTAMSLDGKLALDNLESQWITGAEARNDVHHLRASCDAILTTIGTVSADDPMLTARIEGNTRHPVRLVIDREGKISLETKLVQTAKAFKTILFGDYTEDKKLQLATYGCEIIPYKSLVDIFKWTLKQGLMAILIEAGPRLTTTLLDADLVDEWVIYQSPRVFGGQQSVYQNIKFSPLDEIKRFQAVHTEIIGEDIKMILRQASQLK